jgi:LysR family glycine cleavage system transcriptional activator
MSRRLPSLNALRAFEAAGRHGNFSSAAEELFVTHASISRHVRHLEAWLGRKLFERHSRGVTLTEAGRGYLATLTRLFDELQAATRAISTDRETQLAVSVEETFAMRWLVPRLGSFQKRHPEIELNLDPDDDLIDFRRDDAELAIRYGPGGWPGVAAELLTKVDAFAVCSPDYLVGRRIETAADLPEHALLHEDSKQWWGWWLKEVGVKQPRAIKGPLFQSAHMTLEAAEAGQGFALGDTISAADGLAEGWLVSPLTLKVAAEGYYIVSPKERPMSPAASAFRTWLKEEMAGFLAAS